MQVAALDSHLTSSGTQPASYSIGTRLLVYITLLHETHHQVAQGLYSLIKNFDIDVCVHTSTYNINSDKAVPLQTCSGPEGSRNLRFPDFMTTAQEGGKVVSLTHQPHLAPGNSPGTHFCQRLSRPQGQSAIVRIMSKENFIDTIWDRTSDLPICSTVP